MTVTPHGRRSSLGRVQKRDVRGNLLVVHDGHPADARRDLLEQLQPFSADRGLKVLEAGDIAARARQVCHQAAADRIGDEDKDDGDSLCRLFQRRQTRIGPNVDQFRRACDKLGGAGTNSVDILSCEMHIELNVTAFDPAKFTEPLLECRPEVPHLRIDFILEGNQNANPPHAVAPLRTRRKRPRCHRSAAEKRNELAPLHVRT